MIEHAFPELNSTLFQSNCFLSVPLVKSSGEQDRGSTSEPCSQTTEPSGHPRVSGGSTGSCIAPQSIPLPSSVPFHSTTVSQAQLFSRTAIPCLKLAASQSSSSSGPRTARNLLLGCQLHDRRQRRVSRRDAFQSQRTLVLSLSQ